MTDTLDAPADMRVMGIVHRALRRDLGRARELLAVEAAVTTGQRVALGEHLVWLMSLLHEHHQGEDRGLWPRVRANNPLAGPLLDAMDHDHHALAPGMAEVEQAAQDFRRGGPARPVLDALDRLEGTLLPHLQREEDQMMPVVSATLTQREWAEYDHEQNTQGRSSIRLGMLGHWLIDGLTPAQAQLVTGLVPRSNASCSCAQSARCTAGRPAVGGVLDLPASGSTVVAGSPWSRTEPSASRSRRRRRRCGRFWPTRAASASGATRPWEPGGSTAPTRRSRALGSKAVPARGSSAGADRA